MLCTMLERTVEEIEECVNHMLCDLADVLVEIPYVSEDLQRRVLAALADVRILMFLVLYGRNDRVEEPVA